MGHCGHHSSSIREFITVKHNKKCGHHWSLVSNKLQPHIVYTPGLNNTIKKVHTKLIKKIYERKKHIYIKQNNTFSFNNFAQNTKILFIVGPNLSVPRMLNVPEKTNGSDIIRCCVNAHHLFLRMSSICSRWTRTYPKKLSTVFRMLNYKSDLFSLYCLMCLSYETRFTLSTMSQSFCVVLIMIVKFWYAFCSYFLSDSAKKQKKKKSMDVGVSAEVYFTWDLLEYVLLNNYGMYRWWCRLAK